MKISRSLVATAAYWFMAGAVYAEAPAEDIRQLRSAQETMLKKQLSVEQLADALTPILASHCLAIGDETGITRMARLNGADFQTFMRDFVQEESSYYISLQNKNARAQARLELLQTFTSRTTAENVLADWFDLGRIKMLNGEKLKNDGQFSIHDQVSARELTPGLSLDVDASKLKADIGGPGAGNGQIDNGEWANIELALINQTSQPWFSTSAVAQGTGNCIFVPLQPNNVLAELAIEDHATIQTWVYVSRECGASKNTFTVVIADTWQTPSAKQKLSVDINTVAMGTFRLTPNQVDADDPGHSDGSHSEVLSPERDYEISASVQAGTSFNDASLSLGFGQYDLPFFKNTTMRPVRMHPQDLGQFAPGDDVDVTLLNTDKYRNAFIDRVDTSKWVQFDADESTIWIPVDTTLIWSTTAPEENPQTTGVKEKIAILSLGETTPAAETEDAETAEDEQITAKDDSTEDDEAPTGPRVPFQWVFDLFVENISLIPHPTTPATENGIMATDGYEIVMDEAAIRLAYSTWGIEASETPIEKPVNKRSLTYTYRSYFPLKIYVPPSVAGCMKKRSLSYNKEAVVDNGECDFYRRFDGFASFTNIPKSNSFSSQNAMPIWAPDNVFTNSYGLRAVYGHRPRLSISTAIGAVAPRYFNDDRVLAMRHFTMDIGLGRGFRTDKPLEFELMGQVGFNRYQMLGMLNAGQPNSVLEPSSARNLTYGLASRAIMKFNPTYGAYIGAQYNSSSPLSISSEDPNLNRNSELGVVADESRSGLELGFSYLF